MTNELTHIMQQISADPKTYNHFEKQLETLEPKFYLLKYFILPSLIHQTNTNFKCFIEYPHEAETLFHFFLLNYGLIPNHIQIAPCHYIPLNLSAKNYISSLILSDTENILLIKWDPFFIYSLHLIEYLHQYPFSGNEKVILFDKGAMLNLNTGQLSQKNLPIFNGMAYLCSKREYQRYLTIYEQFHPFTPSTFKNFPKIVLRDISYLLLSGQNSDLNLNTLNNNTKDELKEFIKLL